MTAARLLGLMWLASPALPVGGFSYSEGLEPAVEWAGVRSEAAAADWLSDQMHLAQARGDWPALAQALAAWRAGDLAGVRAANDWVLDTRESSELRLQTEQMGRSLAAWLAHRDGPEAPLPEQLAALAALPPTYPVAFALALAPGDATAEEGLLAYAFGWAENMVQAALKAVPLGQTAGQRILARLAREIPPAVQHALALAPHQRQAFTPMLAILSARHEAQYSRLFRS